MKTWIGILVMGLCLALNSVLYAVTQPQSIGLVTAVIESKTLAQMNVYAAKSAGQLLFVSDALQSRLCVSSGTAAGAWVVAVATGTFTASSYPHCN